MLEPCPAGPPAGGSAESGARNLSRHPPISEFVLSRLQTAFPNGLKAAGIRDDYERQHGIILHEKTIGMTLYRLFKTGAVRREGHMWFFAGPPAAETKNPGGGPPGSTSSSN